MASGSIDLFPESLSWDPSNSMSCHSCRFNHVVSYLYFILTYFNRSGGSTRSCRLWIFVQFVASMVSYCFFSDKRPDRVKNFGLACKKTTLFVDFWIKFVEASYRKFPRKFYRVFYNTCFFFFGFARSLEKSAATPLFGASFRMKLSQIYHQTCREYRRILSSSFWNHTAVLAKRESHRNS